MAALNNFENVLHHLHGNFIKQSTVETARNNRILGNVVGEILDEMKEDKLFGESFSRIFYGGSYYDGMKVGKPDDFDLYLLLSVPKLANIFLEDSDEPGYLQMRFRNPGVLSQAFRNKLLEDDAYLSAKKTQAWMKSVFSIALNKFGTERSGYVFRGTDYYLKGSRSENIPTMILQLHGSQLSIKIHFVPCFEFPALAHGQWPSANFDTQRIFQNGMKFFVVPKTPKPTDAYSCEILWKPSFQEQERELLHDERNLKPTMKLLKRLRDVQQHKDVSSYCIKTVFLWEHMENGDRYWNGSMTDVFFKMLEKYIVYIQSGKIRYFWDPQYNLLNILPARKENIVNRLRKIQQDLLRKYKTEPTVICKYLGYEVEPEEAVAICYTDNRYSLENQDHYNAPRRANSGYSESTSTAESEGLSGFAQFAVGLCAAAAVGVASYGIYKMVSDSNQSEEKKRKK